MSTTRSSLTRMAPPRYRGQLNYIHASSPLTTFSCSPSLKFWNGVFSWYLRGSRSTCSCVIRLATVSIASLYLPTASVTTGEVKEASSDPGVQHGVVGFQVAGVDWSSRNGVEVTRRLMAPTAASLAGLRRIEMERLLLSCLAMG